MKEDIFPNRSRAIQQAVEEKLLRMERNRLARECAKLDLTFEKALTDFPLTLEVKSKGLPKRSWIKISQIRTLSIERIGKKLGRILPEELSRVIEGFNEIIGA